MIHLLFVGDGERDAASVPPLVATILGTEVRAETGHWMRARKAGRGYDRKLLYYMRLVRDRKAAGLVATVDRDKDKKRGRLRLMQKARERDRGKVPPVPTAVGEAVPHGEAWLLDDPKAVRTGLGLPADADIPNVARTKDPKQAFPELLESSPRAGERPLEVIPDVARHITLDRCNHADRTGFKDFVDDVERELGRDAPSLHPHPPRLTPAPPAAIVARLL